MPTLIAGVVAVIVLYSLLQMFRAANPVMLARAIKIVGGVVALAVAAFTGFRGELAVAIPIGIFGAGLLGWSPFGTLGFPNFGGIFSGAGAARSAGQTSQVRSQFLDMTLDHDSSTLNGRIVAGPNAGHSLDEYDLSQLTAMAASFDAENDGRGGLSDPWPATGGGARRDRTGPPCAHEEIASRPGGVDVSRRPRKPGQGYFASHA
jgi:hypothetical protein